MAGSTMVLSRVESFALARCAALMLAFGSATLGLAGPAAAQGQVYRCPGNLYTDQITAKEAMDRGCKTLEGAAVTIVQGTAPRKDGSSKPATSASTAPAAAPASGGPGLRIDPSEQRSRDTDARRILEGELRREEERLAELRKDYNQGEPERLGSERNFAKYQERVADLKAAIARKEADVAALKRELSKLPPG